MAAIHAGPGEAQRNELLTQNGRGRDTYPPGSFGYWNLLLRGCAIQVSKSGFPPFSPPVRNLQDGEVIISRPLLRFVTEDRLWSFSASGTPPNLLFSGRGFFALRWKRLLVRRLQQVPYVMPAMSVCALKNLSDGIFAPLNVYPVKCEANLSGAEATSLGRNQLDRGEANLNGVCRMCPGIKCRLALAINLKEKPAFLPLKNSL